MRDLFYRGEAHRSFCDEVAPGLDEQGKQVAYLLGATATTREHFDDIYTPAAGFVPGCWCEAWNTPESRLLIAWAMAMTGEIEAPVAASGTLARCLMDAFLWSDAADMDERMALD